MTILTTPSFVAGLLIGKVGITANARLKNNFVKEGNENTEEDSKETVIAKTNALIELANIEGGLETMRRGAEHKEIFLIFVNICLFYFCSSMKW